MVRIAITQAAFDAVASTLPRGSVGYENEANERRAPCLVGADRGRPLQGHARPRRERQRRDFSVGRGRRGCARYGPQVTEPTWTAPLESIDGLRGRCHVPTGSLLSSSYPPSSDVPALGLVLVPLPTHLVAELNRLRRRLSLTLEMIRELDAVREQALEAQHDSASRTVKALCTIRGIGVNFASVLTREVFYRTFDNRRQIASYLGLAPTPFRGDASDRKVPWRRPEDGGQDARAWH